MKLSASAASQPNASTDRAWRHHVNPRKKQITQMVQALRTSCVTVKCSSRAGMFGSPAGGACAGSVRVPASRGVTA